MNRLESIKEHLKATSKDGEASITIFAADTVEYLLQRLERYEKALMEISGYDGKECGNIAKNALKESEKE